MESQPALPIFLTFLLFFFTTDAAFDCNGLKNGNYPDPTDCSKFYMCYANRAFRVSCPSGLEFQPSLLVCDWKRNVNCRNGQRDLPDTSVFLDKLLSPEERSMCEGHTEGSMWRNPQNCGSYYWCVNSLPILYYCPQGLMFDDHNKVCDWERNVDCSGTSSVTSAPLTTQRKVFTTMTSNQGSTNDVTTPVTTSEQKVTDSVVKATVSSTNTGSLRRVCYYTNWSQYRPGVGKFMPEDIDPSLCTHVIYAFAKLNGNALAPFEWNDESTDWSDGLYGRFNNLKRTNPQLKTLLAVGGWNMGSAPFTQMVDNKQSRQAFADQAVWFLHKNGFDGLDLDWEYPANRGSPPQDKDKFTALVQQLRETFDLDAARTGQSPLLLTAAVAAGKSTIDTAYDIPKISLHLDFINLMSYDLHGGWETKTGHHSALYARPDETGEDRLLNVDWAARYWVAKGCPKSKLVIGIPTYGRTFTLTSASHTGMGAPATGPGPAGTFTREKGFMAYYEVCQMARSAGVVKKRDADHRVPYLVHGTTWVGYDDQTSVTEKARYVKSNGYGGVMTWALPLDDFTGTVCNQGKYPLWTAVNQEIH